MPARRQPPEFPPMFVKPVEGNSMNLAGIRDGDEICYHRHRRVRDGDIVLAQVGDEGRTVKRLRWRGNVAWLEPESDDPQFRPLRVDDDVFILGIAEGRMDPEMGLMPFLVPVVARQPLPIPVFPTPVREVARTFQSTPLPAAPRRCFTEHVAKHPPENVPQWVPYAGMVGCYEPLDFQPDRQALAYEYAAKFADFVVFAATDCMRSRGIRDGDRLFVTRQDPGRLWPGLVVIADLGDWGAVVGELHQDGARRFLRSNQGRAWKDEMSVEVRDADIQGVVYLVGK